MNSALNEPVRWSARRWLYAFLGIFGLHIGLLLVLGLRPQASVPQPRSQTAIVPVLEPGLEQQIARLPWLQDPTLFVLPTPQAYSGQGWLRIAPLEDPLSDWTEPPRWLQMSEQHLGEPFAGYARTVTNHSLLIADLPLLPLTGSELTVPNQPVGQASKVLLEGDLAGRPWLAPLPLRNWPHIDLLTNTVIQLAVDTEGSPVLTTLLAESGLRAADEYALQEAANARFEPLRRAEGSPPTALPLTWGRLVFQWQTLLPAATNTAARAP